MPPKLIVFDLDDTLWDLDVEGIKRPFYTSGTNEIKDDKGRLSYFFNGVPGALASLNGYGFKMSIASNNGNRPKAEAALQKLVINAGNGNYSAIPAWDLFKYNHPQIRPETKDVHFKELKRKLGINFSDMLFFDDKPSNRRPVEHLGVTFVLVPSGGLTHSLVQSGLNKWNRSH